MTADAPSTLGERVPMESLRKTALAAGVLYLVTIAASIPALALKAPVLDHTDFILGAGSDTSVLWACVLDFINALACIGTAVVLYRVARRQSETAAIAFVAARVLEAAVITVGVVSLFSIVTLRQDLAGATGADAAVLVTIGRSLVAIHNWTFLLGPGFIPGINALCLAYVLHRARLVPRLIPTMGLVGAPMLLASSAAVMFGIYDQVSLVSAVAALPIAAWELSLGLWLVIKGFGPSPITHGMATETSPLVTDDAEKQLFSTRS